MLLEDSLLTGLNKDSLIALKAKKDLTLEDKIILINTYVDLWEYNFANQVMDDVKNTLQPMKKDKLYFLMEIYLENKILVNKTPNDIIKNTDNITFSNFDQLRPREKTFIILIQYLRAETYFRLGNYTTSQEILKNILQATSDTKIDKPSLSDDVINGLYFRVSFMNYNRLGDLENATHAVYNGLEIYERTHNLIYLTYFQNFKGVIFSLKGDYFSSLEAFRESIRYFESVIEPDEINSINYTVTIYTNIASLLKDQGRLKESIDMYKRVLALYEQNGVRHEVANCYNSLGQCYRENQMFDLAKDYFFKSFKIRKEIGEPMEISESLLNMCILDEKMGKLTADSMCFKEFPKNSQSSVVKFDRLMMDGLLTFSQKKFDLALEKLNEAFGFQGIELSYKLQILDYQASIFLEKDDFKHFSNHLKLWKALTKENNLIPSLFKAYLIDFRFNLLFLDFDSAKNSLKEAFNIAQNYSNGALKLVEENEELLQQRLSLIEKVRKSDQEIKEEADKDKEILELKAYINEIASFLTKSEKTKS